jgi:hypothetical protein
MSQDPGQLPPPPPAPPGELSYHKMVAAAGFAAADQWRDEQSAKMVAAGAKPSTIQGYWGQAMPNYGPVTDGPLADHIANNLARNDGQAVADKPLDYLAAGWDHSVAGLVQNKGAQPMAMPQNPGFVGSVLSSVSQAVGDSPWSVGGFVLGAAAGGGGGVAVAAPTGEAASPATVPVGMVLGGGFGAGALPQAMREILVDAHNANANMTWQDAMKTATHSLVETGKAGITSGLSMLVGGKATEVAAKAGATPALAGFANAGAQATTAATVGAGLDGRVPNANDWAVGVTVMLGLHAGTVVTGRSILSSAGGRVAKNLQDIYRQSGIPPWEATAAAQHDGVLRDEIMGQDAEGQGNFAKHLILAPNEVQPYAQPLRDEHIVPRNDVGPPGAPLRLTGPRPLTARDVIPGLETGGLRPTQQNAAVSSAGALGKNQIMLGTARQYMGKDFDVSTLHDPKVNDAVYQRIMDALEKRFPGNPDAQLIAYNAGPGRAAEFLKAGPGTRLRAIPDPKMRGGLRYEPEDAPRDEAFLPRETQEYLAKARYRGTSANAEAAWPPPGHSGSPSWEEPAATAEAERPPGEAESLSAASSWKGADESTLTEELLSNVGEQPKPSGFWNRDRMVSAFVSELNPARMVDSRLQEAGLYDRDRDYGVEDAFRQAAYGSAARANVFVRYGQIDPLTRDLIPGSYSAMDAVGAVIADGGSFDGFKAHLFAERTLEKQGQGITTGFNPLAAAEKVRVYGEAYKRGTAILNNVSDGFLDYMRKAGIYSKEIVDKLRENNRYYVTFRRILGEGTGGGGRNFMVRDPLHKMEGGDGQVIDPFIAMTDNWRHGIQMADRNMAFAKLVALAEADKETAATLGMRKAGQFDDPNYDELDKILKQYGFSDEELDTARKSYGKMFQLRSLQDNEFPFFRDGELERWVIDDPDLAKMIRGVTSPGEVNAIVKTAESFAALQRAGVVLNPNFITRTVVWHQFNQWLMDPHSPPPIITLSRGLFHAFQGDALFQDTMAKGGMAAHVTLDKSWLEDDQHALLEATGALDKTWNVVKHPLEAVQWLHERLDAANRIGLRLHYEGLGIDPQKAVTLGRKAGIDYAERGTNELMNQVSRMTTFFRPHITGIKQGVEALQDHPWQTMTKAAVGIGGVAILAYMLNRVYDATLPDDRKNESFANINQREKDQYLILPPVAGVRLKLRWPANFGFFFGTMTNRLMDSMVAHDPEAFDGWQLKALQEFLPNPTPTIATPPLEVITNHNFLTGLPLISDSQRRLSPDMQYTETTTKPARALAAAIGVVWQPLAGEKASPLVVQHMVQGYTGTMGMAALHALDVPFKDPGPPSELADNIFVGGFFVRHPIEGQTVSTFYHELGQFETAHADLKMAVQRSMEGGGASEEELTASMHNPQALSSMRDLQQVSEAMKMQRVLLKGIYKDPTMTTDEKRQQIDKIASDMARTAQMGLDEMRMISSMKDNP